MVRPARISTFTVIACLVLLGCSSGSEEPGAADTTGAPSPVATRPAPAVEDSASPGAMEQMRTETTSGLSGLGSAELLIASDRGVDVITPDGGQVALTAIPAVSAFADGAGGVVFQGMEPPGEDPPSAAIMWLPASGGDAVTIVPDGFADVVTLQDAGLVDGEASAVFTVRTDAHEPEQSTETLTVQPVEDGEPRPVTDLGGWESGAHDVTLGGDVLAANMHAESTTWFAFFDLDGEPLEVPANPLPESEQCQGEPGCPYLVTIGDTGERIAWLTGDVGEGGTLTVVPADQSRPAATIAWSAQPDGVSFERLGLAGGTAVISRVQDTGDGFTPIAPLVVDLATQQVRDAGMEGFAAVDVAG